MELINKSMANARAGQGNITPEDTGHSTLEYIGVRRNKRILQAYLFEPRIIPFSFTYILSLEITDYRKYVLHGGKWGI